MSLPPSSALLRSFVNLVIVAGRSIIVPRSDDEAESLRMSKYCFNLVLADLTLNCLGSWPGPGGSNYLALWDNNSTEGQPRYRCGVCRSIFYLKETMKKNNRMPREPA